MENWEGLRPKQQQEEEQQQQQNAKVQFENPISRTCAHSIGASAKAKATDDYLPEESGRGPTDPKVSGVLLSLSSQAHGCRYEFAEYFVAWQGVLTVAFSGIPPSICQLKRKINLQLGTCLASENPGSKWPKISLGCLRDGATLTLDQLRRLTQICSEERSSLAATEPVLVDDLSVVLYANCCLERTVTVTTIPLAFPVDLSGPSAEEAGFVQEVLNECTPENVESYHSFTSKGGNRSAHYRNSKAGATLVHFLKSVPIVLAGFRARVDSQLPGMYDWFRDDSLHITVRTLF